MDKVGKVSYIVFDDGYPDSAFKEGGYATYQDAKHAVNEEVHSDFHSGLAVQHRSYTIMKCEVVTTCSVRICPMVTFHEGTA